MAKLAIDRVATPAVKKTATPGSKPQPAGKPEPVESQSLREMTEVELAMKAQDKSFAARFKVLTDTEYWCCICFQTREQKDEFLAKSGWKDATGSEKFIDGMRLAKHLGIKLESPVPPPMKFRRFKL